VEEFNTIGEQNDETVNKGADPQIPPESRVEGKQSLKGRKPEFPFFRGVVDKVSNMPNH